MRGDTVIPRGAEPVAVIGLGKVGLGFAACLARNGFDVLGIDRDTRLVEAIHARTAVFDEPGLDAAIANTTKGSFRASTDIAAAVGHGQTVFLLLPTPSRPDGTLCAAALVEALTELCQSIRAGHTGRFLIVIGSTVSPGTINGTLIPVIERMLPGAAGDTISICYSPELVALGSVVADFERPDLIIIGACHADAGAEVERIYRKFVRNDPAIHQMSLVNAEISKLALNNFLAVKISFANVLAQLCARTEGADVDTITGALASDSRIGGKYLRAGPAFGGPCLPRDTAAFAAWARQCGRPADFIEAVEAINEAQHHLLVETVRRNVELSGNHSVGLLGLSYKPSTPYVIGSPSLGLIRTLHADGIRLTAYDSRALRAAALEVGEMFEPADSPAACLGAAPVVVLMHPESAYTEAIRAYRGREPKIVVDCWRALDAYPATPNVTVAKLGSWSALI